MPSLNSWTWYILENYIYNVPSPPPRVRSKPMEVLCVGLPRSGTESLQQALLTLGYDYTYHGWDMLFETPHRMPGWVRLARKKYFSESLDGDCSISAADFDELLGHSVAVTDAAGSVFAAELINAYPDAKVVLNVRRDLDAWHASAMKTLVGISESRAFWFMSWWSRDLFWSWHVYERFLWHRLFRCTESSLNSGIGRNGKWIYREHCNMIRGLVTKGRLLEWSVEDGWEPLCEFLGKEVPNEPFPTANQRDGFAKKEEEIKMKWMKQVAMNMAIFVAVVVGCGSIIWKVVR